MADPTVAVAYISAGGALAVTVVAGLFQKHNSRKADGETEEDLLDANPTEAAVLSAALSAVVRERDEAVTRALAERDEARQKCADCEIRLAILRGIPDQERHDHQPG